MSSVFRAGSQLASGSISFVTRRTALTIAVATAFGRRSAGACRGHCDRYALGGPRRRRRSGGGPCRARLRDRSTRQAERLGGADRTAHRATDGAGRRLTRFRSTPEHAAARAARTRLSRPRRAPPRNPTCPRPTAKARAAPPYHRVAVQMSCRPRRSPARAPALDASPRRCPRSNKPPIPAVAYAANPNSMPVKTARVNYFAVRQPHRSVHTAFEFSSGHRPGRQNRYADSCGGGRPGDLRRREVGL